MRIRATIQLHGKTATGIELPGDVVTALGDGKRPRVKVTHQRLHLPEHRGHDGRAVPHPG